MKVVRVNLLGKMDRLDQKSDVPQIHLEKLWSKSFAVSQNLTGQISQLGQSVHFGEKEAGPNQVATASLSAIAAALWICQFAQLAVNWIEHFSLLLIGCGNIRAWELGG